MRHSLLGKLQILRDLIFKHQYFTAAAAQLTL